MIKHMAKLVLVRRTNPRLKAMGELERPPLTGTRDRSARRKIVARAIRAGAMGAPLAFAVALGLFTAPEIAAAQASPAATNPLQESMMFIRVRSDDTACQPDCPAWISAQGKIEIGTAQAFARVIASLGGRRLPILINSPGGSALDALAMGRLIRKKQLAVAVARTVLAPCAPPAATCDQRLGKAISLGAACASACPLVLAGGVERYASPLSYIGVHQVTVMLTKQFVIRRYQVQYRIIDGRKEEISRSLVGESLGQRTMSPGSPDQIDQDIGAYLKEMGVGSPVMEAILTTSTKDLHHLNWQELGDSNLVTIWIDSVSAMVGGIGVNGLAGVPTAPSPGRQALFAAKGSWPFALPVTGKTVALQASFAYRRGGGVIEAILATRDSMTGDDVDVRGRGFTVKLTPGDAGYRVLKPVNGDPIRQTMPLAQFCKLSSQGRIVIEPFDGSATNIVESEAVANPHEPPISIDIRTIDGMSALFGEACSPLSLPAAKRL
jgi:hypothetical protein